jgi:hypothetical protein
MNRRRRAARVFLATILAAGCASQLPMRLPAVGPIGAAKAGMEPGQPTMMGTLIVHSEELPIATHRSPPAYPHTGYVIRRANGQLVAQVDNHTASAESQPEEVALPAGLYEVQARAAKVGTVVVPVIIAPGGRTEVYLDASGMPAAQARALTDPVTLSDGRVVGARGIPAEPPL